MKKILTLCMIVRDAELLLGMKKRGFGVGRWNGFGGKVEEGESIEAAAHRELIEESGLVAGSMREVGVLDFSFEHDPKVLEVHVFKIVDFSGSPVETEEMRPQWFKTSEIPYANMWPDDAHWMPYLLEDKLFRGKFMFDRPSDAEYTARILSMELTEVTEL